MKSIDELYRSIVDDIRRQAPPPPISLLRERIKPLFDGRAQSTPPLSGEWLAPYKELLTRLVSLRPSAWAEAHAERKGAAISVREAPLGLIPGYILREGTAPEETMVEVFQKPSVAEGRLVLGVRVPMISGQPGDRVELALAPPPGCKWAAPTAPVQSGVLEVVTFDLPLELSVAWQEIGDSTWNDLPVRFLVKPITATQEAAIPSSNDAITGDACGQSVRGGVAKPKKLLAAVRCLLAVWLSKESAPPVRSSSCLVPQSSS